MKYICGPGFRRKTKLIFNKKSGFTLLELVITMVCAGILFMVVGSLLVNVLAPYTRQNVAVVMDSEFKYAEMVIRNQFRGMLSIVFMSPTVLVYQTSFGPNFMIALNGLTNNIEFTHAGGPEVIMRDVTNLNFTANRDWRGYLVSVTVDITQTKQVSPGLIGISPPSTGGAAPTRTNTERFTVYLTNVARGT